MQYVICATADIGQLPQFQSVVEGFACIYIALLPSVMRIWLNILSRL